MKLRTRLSASIIPVLIIGVILINVTFGGFLQNLVKAQEEMLVAQSEKNITQYLSDRKDKYIGSVNDWAHWTETYNFLAGNFPEYREENVITDTFENLDVNFFILTTTDGTVVLKEYYYFGIGEMGGFSIPFQNSMNKAMQKFTNGDDHYGIVQIGDTFYFVSSSSVTDSNKAKAPNGYLIIGRQISWQIIDSLEKISGCTLESIREADNEQPRGSLLKGSVPVFEKDAAISEDNNTIRITLVAQNEEPDFPDVEMGLTMDRYMYVMALERVLRFAVFNTVAMLVIAIIVFLIVGRYLSKPFTDLVNELKAIDTSVNRFAKLPGSKISEFSFVSESINYLLSRIEAEHSKVVSNEEKLQATLLSVGDGVVSVDNTGMVQFLNPVAEHLTGWTLKEALNQPIDKVFHIINEYTRDPVESPVKIVIETQEIVDLTNHTLLVSRDGTERPIEDTAAPIRDAHGQTIGCVLVFRDFSERKERQRRIEYLSYHDQLSGLYNRRFFEEELRRLDVSRNLPISFIYSDVNGLKTINDAFGHQVGDQLIRQVSEAMKAECRADDIIARTGGDEFIILLPKTDSHAVEKITERIHERVEKIKFMEIGASIAFGWSTKLLESQNVWDVLKKAENKMYQNKILHAASKRNAVIRSILNALLVKSPRENAHSKRVSKLCEDMGVAFNLKIDDIRELKTAGELHDIGKIAVDETLLDKTDKLSDNELAQIKQHPEIGFRLLNTSNEFYFIAEYVLAHHERWDGTGYPRGLSGEAIPWKARIIAIADSYDAMTSDRPYRKAMTTEEAIAELKRGAGTQFDPDVAKVFVENVLQKEW